MADHNSGTKNATRLSDEIKIAGGLTASAALLAGTAILFPVVTAVTAGSVLLLGSLIKLKSADDYDMKSYDLNNEISPSLKTSFDKLFCKLDNSKKKYKIYDFSVENQYSGKGSVLKNIFSKISRSYNAAAILLPKTTFAITRPLLNLLNDKEATAVMAHELGHEKANARQKGKANSLINGMTGLSNGVQYFGTLFSIGFVNFVLANLAGIGINIAGLSAFKKKVPVEKYTDMDEKAKLNLEYVNKKIANRVSQVSSLAIIGVANLFNPMVAPVWLGTTAIARAAGLVSKSISRTMEYQADRTAVEFFEADPLALVTSFRKIEKANAQSVEEYLGRPLPKKGLLTRVWGELNADHPSSPRRIKRLTKMAVKRGYLKSEIEQAVKGDLDMSGYETLPLEAIRTRLGLPEQASQPYARAKAPRRK